MGIKYRDSPGTKGILDWMPKAGKKVAHRHGKRHQTQKEIERNWIERAVGAQQCFLLKEIQVQPADGLMATACDSKIQRDRT